MSGSEPMRVGTSTPFEIEINRKIEVSKKHKAVEPEGDVFILFQ